MRVRVSWTEVPGGAVRQALKKVFPKMDMKTQIEVMREKSCIMNIEIAGPFSDMLKAVNQGEVRTQAYGE